MQRITVCDYSENWPKQYEKLRSLIWPTVSAYALDIQHVGSTSVPGLAAKPVIDIDIIIESSKNLPDVLRALASLNYKHRGDLGIVGREAFKKEGAEIAHNLYVCLDGCLALRNHLLLRDHLRENPKDCKTYSKLKRELSEKFSDDIEAYTEGKTKFIIQILSSYAIEESELNLIEAVNKK